MGVILRRRVDKIDEDFQDNKSSYVNEIAYNKSAIIFKLLSSLVNARISLNFIMQNINDNDTKQINLKSNSDISTKRLAGNLIEAFVIKFLTEKNIINDSNINSNSSPDFSYDNVNFEIKAYYNNISNLSLGRFDTIKDGLLSDVDNRYKNMTAIIFKYDIDANSNEIIIKRLDVIPFIFLINKNFMLKGGGSTQVRAGNYSTGNKEDYNKLLNELRNILNAKNKENTSNDK